MKALLFAALSAVFISTPIQAADGLVNVESTHTVQETADRMEALLNKKGITLFARIDHAEGAEKAGIELRDTQLLIFGNPKLGGPLMQCQQTVGIELPLKALIWEDESGKTWISYNDPSYFGERHQISGCEEVLVKMEKALGGLTQAAAGE